MRVISIFKRTFFFFFSKAKEMNYPPESLKIRAGLWNLLDDQHEEEFFQDRLVRETNIHPLYNRHVLIYDHALLVLSEPLDFSNGRIGKICLPNAEEDLSQSPECIVTGWGKNNLGMYSISTKQSQNNLTSNSLFTRFRFITEKNIYLHNTNIIAKFLYAK